jgi:hypothetical protein
MALFHLDAVLILEVIAFSAGLVVLHFGKLGSAILLRTAGWVLIVASLGTAACTLYYGIRYHVQGEFDHAYGAAGGCPGMHAFGPMGAMHGGMHGGPGMGMGMGMGQMHGGMSRMQGGMGMHGGAMMTPPPAAEPDAGAAPPAASEGKDKADAAP